MKGVAYAVLFICVDVAAGTLPRFPDAAVWNQSIEAAPLHPNSALMIATLDALAGFGGTDFRRMQIDFSLHVVHAPPGAPTRTIVSHPQGYYSPDCDELGTEMPVPPDAAIEGESGLDCDNLDNDCHLLVVQGDTLYEAYRVTANGDDALESQCLAIWRLDVIYPPQGRGEHCTSADAAGFPMAPLMFNADDIAGELAVDPAGNGDLGHAIRFVIRNERMASDEALGGVDGRLYVRPASHAGRPSGPVDSIPYGARLRLRPDFPLDGYNPAARVILNTFMRFGIVLADGGNIALTAESDLYTETSWDDLDVNSRIFDLTPNARDVDITDFEVIDTGPRIAETYECVRTVLPMSFSEGFEAL